MECAASTQAPHHSMDTDGEARPPLEPQNKVLVDTLREFNKSRRILLSDIPRATYEEIREYFGEYGVADITINRKMQSATVLLRNGAEAEDITLKLKNKPLLNERIGVSVRPNYNLLCVAHLPFSMTDATLTSFAAQMGIVERCFLMRSEKTGHSKGYGFIEFAHNRDHTNTIRLKIDRKLVGGSVVHCDFAAAELTSYSSMHSKCLLLNNLPLEASDQALNEACAKVCPVQYLQTGIANGKCLGFAIVECRTADQAERLQTFVHGRQLFPEKHVSATYCIPGIPGKELFDKLMTMRMKANPSTQQPTPPSMVPNAAPAANNNANPMLQSLFQQLQVLQQNFQHMLQAGKQNYYNNNRAPMTSPLNNPMIQQAISLLVLSMNQQQQQMGPPPMNNYNQPRNLQNTRMMSPSAAQGHPLLQNMMSQIRTQLNNLQGQQYMHNQQRFPPRHPQPYNGQRAPLNRPPRPGMRPPVHQRMNAPIPRMMPPPARPPPYTNGTTTPNSTTSSCSTSTVGPQNATTSTAANGSVNGARYPNQYQYQNNGYHNHYHHQQQQPQQHNGTYNPQPNQNAANGTYAMNQPNQQQHFQQNLSQSLQPLMNNLQTLLGSLQQPSQAQQGHVIIQTIMNGVTSALTNLMRGQQPQQGGAVVPEAGKSVVTTGTTSTQAATTAAQNRDAGQQSTGEQYSKQEYTSALDEEMEKEPEKVPVEAEKESETSSPDDLPIKTEPPENEEELVDRTTDDSFDATLKQIADYGSLIRDCYGESGYNQFQSMTDDTKARQASLWAQQGAPASWELSGTGDDSSKTGTATGYKVDHEALKRIFNGAKPELTRSTSVQEERRTMTPISDKDDEEGGNMSPPLSSTTPASQALKRSASYSLPDPEPSPEGDYVGLHSQGIGGHYADSYIKRKRLL